LSEHDAVEVVDGVASGSLERVVPGWWGPPGHAVDDLDPPAGVGEVLVVVRADEGEIVQVGVAVLDPL